MQMHFRSGIVCSVLANSRTKSTVYTVLDHYSPTHKPLDGDYGCWHTPYDDPEYTFGSEDEMLEYYAENIAAQCTFYWSLWVGTPTQHMVVGACFTSDGQLVMSVTINAEEEEEEEYLEELKTLVNSQMGVISYVNPADFTDGQDFVNRYSNP